jgi:hypothetical protein
MAEYELQFAKVLGEEETTVFIMPPALEESAAVANRR